MVALELIWSRYLWAFATGFHVIVTLLDVAADWTRPDGVGDAQSAARAGVASPASSAAAAMAARLGRVSERMMPPGKMCQK
jgi:hypothetical protein